MRSAYAIGPHVWIVSTDEVAEEKVPTTLPIGSVILSPEDAVRLANQMLAAAKKTRPRAQRAPKVLS